MSKSQFLISKILIVVLISGNLLALISKKEYWPFSNYPMYSWWPNEDQPSILRVFGLTKDSNGNIVETEMRGNQDFFPFSELDAQIAVAMFRLKTLDKAWQRHVDPTEEYFRRKQTGLIKLFNYNLENNVQAKHGDGKLSMAKMEKDADRKFQRSVSSPLVGMRVYNLIYPNKSLEATKAEPQKKLISEVMINE